MFVLCADCGVEGGEEKKRTNKGSCLVFIMSFELQIWFFSSKFRFFSVRFSLTSAAAGVAGTAGTAASRQIMNRYANEQAFLFFFSFFLFFIKLPEKFTKRMNERIGKDENIPRVSSAQPLSPPSKQ